MEYRWARFKSLVKRVVGEDTLFSGEFIIDPYQKCDIGCIYCDAAEDPIFIKSDALDLLDKEMETIDGLVILGSATDPYQLIERRLKLTRKIIKKLVEAKKHFHILTKSNLVLRDIDLLSKGASVTISISTINKKISRILEPNAPPPGERLEAMKKLISRGINAGVAIMPLLPYITEIEKIVSEAKMHGARYVIYGYLELKGFCKEKFFKFLEENMPDYVDLYKELYHDIYTPLGYEIGEKIKTICKKYNLKVGFAK